MKEQVKIVGTFIREAAIDGFNWLLKTAAIILICILMGMAGYILVNLNCVTAGDLPMACTMIDNQGVLKGINNFLTQ